MDKKQIIVVDDEAISREIFKNCLTDQYQILIAENGDDALEKIEKANFEIAIILLDLRMPGMNGIRFLKKREEIPKLKKIPVIVVTAFDDTEIELEALESGADDVLIKPFDRRILLKRVSNLIEMSRAKSLNEEITALKQNQTFDLRDKKLQKVIDYVSEGVLIFEIAKELHHVFINNGLCKVLGYTKSKYEELTKDNINALVHPDDLEELNKKIKNITKKHGELQYTYRLKKSNKKYIWMNLKGNIIIDNQEKVFFCGIYSPVDQIKDQIEKDELTGLCSQDSFEQIVDMFFKGNTEEAKNSRMAAIFMIDIDNFKSINDHFGHIYGDHVLIEIGNKIHSIFRDEDIVAHVGGDEFCAFIPHQIPQEIIDLRARQLCEAIKTEYRVAGEVVSTSCSVGVAIAPQHGNSYKQLYKNGDKALYLAKKAGKNKYIIFDKIK